MKKQVYVKRKKKKANYGLWVAFALVFLMVSSTVGFLTFQKQGSFSYGVHTFTQTAQGDYSVVIEDQRLVFQYLPDSVDDIEIPKNVMDTILGSRVITVTYDPNDEEKGALALIQYKMKKILGEMKNVYVVLGLVNATGYNSPELSCANATFQNPVVLLQSDNETSFVKEGNCVIITGGSSAELAQIHDRLLYGLLGVIA